MFARSKAALTFLCLVVALDLATVSEANSLVHPARGHAELSRMIKKRVPQSHAFPLLPVIGAAGDPDKASAASTDSVSATSTDSASASSTSASSAASSSSVATTSSSAATSSSSAASSSSSAATSSESASATSSSSAETSSSAATTSSSSVASTPSVTPSSTSDTNLSFTQAPDPNTDTQAETPRHTQTNTVTLTDSSQAQPTTGASTTGASSSGSSAHLARTTIIVIAAVGASVGAIALAWTIFRKWKLRPSSDFDDRMQPIDWQPTAPEDGGIIPNHRRAGSNASHGSFQSSGHSDGHAAAPRLQPLPEHDFTAGPSTLAPVGGYADLQRGPSPQPSMAELQRGPSMTRPGYDYGAPAQYQGMGAYDYNHGMRY
ncbi:hypothetical protein C8Q77DRAFT_1152588 [Trametes polyzona]|nr:hypothetical protein C8Q77DRAFT_1152588 [Trametes polyzona]